jgi:hypothetical protein
MNKFYTFLALLTLALPAQTSCVITGMAIFPKTTFTLIDVHLDIEYPHLRDINIQQMNKLLCYLKSEAEKGTSVCFFIEAREWCHTLDYLRAKQRAVDHLKKAKNQSDIDILQKLHPVTLEIPIMDSLQNGRKQGNFEYIWYDQRDNKDPGYIDNPLDTPPTLLRERYLKALNRVENANLSQTIKSQLTKNIVDTYNQRMAIVSQQGFLGSISYLNICDVLNLDTDTKLICGVLEKMNSHSKTIVVALGGSAHITMLNEAIRQTGFNPKAQKNIVSRPELYNAIKTNSYFILNNFSDEIIMSLEKQKATMRMVLQRRRQLLIKQQILKELKHRIGHENLEERLQAKERLEQELVSIQDKLNRQTKKQRRKIKLQKKFASRNTRSACTSVDELMANFEEVIR